MNYLKRILSLILISGLVTACGFPAKLVVPEIEYETYAQIKSTQTDCTYELDVMEQMFISGSGLEQEDAAINALKCYRAIWKIWENHYRILDAKLRVYNNEEN